MHSLLDGVSNSYASEIDRPAMGTARREYFHEASVFAALPVAPRLVRTAGPELCRLGPSLWPPVGRLASRAALISSGVLTSGSESFTCCFARET